MQMTPEEFQKIKEAEKEHLRSLKKLKQAVRNLERQKKVTDAVEGIRQTEDLMNENENLVDQLAIETAQNEARLEIALESAAEQESLRRAEEARKKLDADLQKIRAKDLVRQLKNQMGEVDTPVEEAPAETSAESAGPDAPVDEDEGDSSEELPDKTLGRMRRK